MCRFHHGWETGPKISRWQTERYYKVYTREANHKWNPKKLLHPVFLCIQTRCYFQFSFFLQKEGISLYCTALGASLGIAQRGKSSYAPLIYQFRANAFVILIKVRLTKSFNVVIWIAFKAKNSTLIKNDASIIGLLGFVWILVDNFFSFVHSNKIFQ